MDKLNPQENFWLSELGITLYRARIKKRENLTDCGVRIGLSRQTYRKMEQGSPTVDIGHYIKALNYYGILGGEFYRQP
ncbi:MAG: helix-turn-helix transcriptional regulator [Methylococcales bacterium]|jgi:transcriptional regulator with XRE-family HTH domain|nr:helix-turn-helix transcriptional regulator [Methylococcales bacterium]